MDRRIMGLETEFGITSTSAGTRTLTPDEAARQLFRPIVAWGRSSNVFLENGARLYLDVGSHPEYATAECDTLSDLLVQDRAGEAILVDLLAQAQRRMAEEGVTGRIHLLKNNVDSSGNSYGCHENYLVERSSDFDRVADAFLPFLVSRQLVTGAGRVVRTSQGAHFELSQRAAHVWEGVSSATTRSRPIINTRDEPHADAQRYRRLHVIVGDSNMTETSTLLKVGAGHLVLRLLEAGEPVRDLALENPIKAIRALALDPGGRTPVRLAAGGTATGLEIQTEYLQRASDFVAREGSADPLTGRVLELWQRALRAIEDDRLDDVGTEVDWVVKKRLLEAFMTRHGLGLDDPRVAHLDLAFHDISPERGVHRLLERSGKVARVTDAAEVERATTTPPATTRARVRGGFLRVARANGADVTVDWTHIKVNDPAQRTVLCQDPFAAHDERVDRLVTAITAAGGVRGGTAPSAPRSGDVHAPSNVDR